MYIYVNLKPYSCFSSAYVCTEKCVSAIYTDSTLFYADFPFAFALLTAVAVTRLVFANT